MLQKIEKKYFSFVSHLTLIRNFVQFFQFWQVIELPLLNPELFLRVGISPPERLPPLWAPGHRKNPPRPGCGIPARLQLPPGENLGDFSIARPGSGFWPGLVPDLEKRAGFNRVRTRPSYRFYEEIWCSKFRLFNVFHHPLSVRLEWKVAAKNAACD